jgi:hypothetical protein
VVGELTWGKKSFILLLLLISIIIINNNRKTNDRPNHLPDHFCLPGQRPIGAQPNTARTYRNALNVFREVLKERWLDPETTPTEKLTEDAITWLASYLKNFSTPTERLYLTAVSGFYKYLSAERLADINLSRISSLILQRARRPGIRLPQFPSEDIERVLDFCGKYHRTSVRGRKGKVTRIKGQSLPANAGGYRFARARSLWITPRGYRLERGARHVSSEKATNRP